MIAADHPGRGDGKVLVVSADGDFRHHSRADLARLFEPGDLVVANDAMTLPASLAGTHHPSGEPIEVRLAGWGSSPATRGRGTAYPATPERSRSGFAEARGGGGGEWRTGRFTISPLHHASHGPPPRSQATWEEPGSTATGLVGDPTRFIAVVFGQGDHRTRTEERSPPPALLPGDRLALGPLIAIVERTLGHPRLIALSFQGSADSIWAGLAQHGRPIQYAHVPQPLAISDVWTKIAARPVAFEAPSAGFALDWRTLAAWRSRGVGFATLTHAAGISSTGDAALDERLPFDEPYSIPQTTATAIARTRSRGGKIIAIGTTVVRALEAAAERDGKIHSGEGIATGRIEPDTEIKIVDAILSGVHQPGESHFELLRAFTDDFSLDRAAAEFELHGYRSHEFGDSVLIERRPRLAPAILSSSGEAKRRPEDPGASIYNADDRPIPAMAGRIIAAEFRRIDPRRASSVQK